MKLVGISELKDNLSVHLGRVRTGEISVVTDRKSPTATLERIPPGSLTDTEQRMISDGIIAPRKELLDVGALLAMPLGHCPAGLVSAILQERDETR